MRRPLARVLLAALLLVVGCAAIRRSHPSPLPIIMDGVRAKDPLLKLVRVVVEPAPIRLGGAVRLSIKIQDAYPQRDGAVVWQDRQPDCRGSYTYATGKRR